MAPIYHPDSLVNTPTATHSYSTPGNYCVLTAIEGSTGYYPFYDTIQTNIEVMPISLYSFADTAYYSYEWNGYTYTESGVYEQTLQNVNGCDSIVTLNLHVIQPEEITMDVVACDTYTFNGITYSEIGENSYTQYDGDTIYFINLNLYPLPVISNIIGEPLIELGGAVSSGISKYSIDVSGLVIDDYPDKLDFKWSNTNPVWFIDTLTSEEPNSVYVIAGQPGNDTLKCTVTTLCGEITKSLFIITSVYGISDNYTNYNIYIKPNPTDGIIYIEYEGIFTNTPVNVYIYDSRGLLLDYFTDVFSDKATIEYNMGKYGNGLYFIRIINKDINFVNKVILN